FFAPFSTYWLADPPDLHSFPTRRSSDLQRLHQALANLAHFLQGQPALVELPVEQTFATDFLHQILDPCGGWLHQHAARAFDGIRSEEHTSELQSRENLVCRLLLEKKN